jgi:hypothetical protein
VKLSEFHIPIGATVLVTCSNWFYAPNGQTYRAVFGTLNGIRTAKETLGIEPQRPSTNWYLDIGCMVIAGCQVHYVIRTATCNLNGADSWSEHEGKVVEAYRPSAIYNADASA